MSALKKSGFDSAQGFPYESSPHIVYKILYVNSFLVLLFFTIMTILQIVWTKITTFFKQCVSIIL